MSTEIPLKTRPWLRGRVRNTMTGKNTLHFDLYAYMDGAQYWFVIEARQGGYVLKAQQALKYDALTNTLVQGQPRWDMLMRLQWRKLSHGIFKAIHGRLLALCVLPPEYARKSICCHYLRVLDVSPWPRDWSNKYKERKARPGARPVGRPVGRPRVRSHTVTEEPPRPAAYAVRQARYKARPGDWLYEKERALCEALERACGIEPEGRDETWPERLPRSATGDNAPNAIERMRRARLARALAHLERTGRMQNLL